MDFIKIRQAVDRRIKKKTDIHEDNSQASALSFSPFVKALIVRKYATVYVSSKALFSSFKCGVFRAAMSQALCWPEDKRGQVTDNASTSSDLWDKRHSCRPFTLIFK